MTTIQWTDETWNLIVGCSRISPGCERCYAATAAKSARLQQFPQYQKVKDWDGTVEFVESQLLKPLRWKKPKRIFVCSMSDLFHENVPDEWIDKVLAVASLCPQHTFQILTKRPHRALQYLTRENRFAFIDYQAYEILRAGRTPYTREHPVVSLPLKNCWIGTTVENQAMANKRIPTLLQIPAAARFLSCEPLLEAIDLSEWLICPECQGEQLWYEKRTGPRLGVAGRKQCFKCKDKRFYSDLSWAIIGGESGPGARPCSIDWIRSAARQCQEAEIPVFVKQLGSNCCVMPGLAFGYSDRKGGDIAEFPEDLKMRQFPNTVIS
ncbi:phage Gp37/Gp68 family protein [Nostoc sp. CENA67]|uniref:Phage Gp37/Gp68 family protein n=1 Tax=Amazonocrinis nigriterrae CENA67 TaxID=2794033 RepID=A0A8J7HVS2_9NOST|nr:phage Gp37/Gp68 family protein [Amazonocrinis nigriterrae]MBH8566756.1 phage Gp37/Gp68 family protein [Amazonocrinis nigriterrae CENA67]